MLWQTSGFDQNKVHCFDILESTMKTAADTAKKGCPDFTVITAEKQEKGRGRLQRKWLSAEGGLYFTLILRPCINRNLVSKINFAASLVLTKTLISMFNIPAKVKWPNDILVNEKKICGMLSEIEVKEDIVSYLNIGIGINVNNNPSLDESRASSIKGILGRRFSRRDILFTFLKNFENYIKESSFEDIILQWKQHTITLNRRVEIFTVKETAVGIAEDVDSDGSLILELDDGTLKKVVYGDCFHFRKK